MLPGSFPARPSNSCRRRQRAADTERCDLETASSFPHRCESPLVSYVIPALILSFSFSRFVTELIAVAFCCYLLLRSALHRDWGWVKLPPVTIALAAWALLILVVAPLSADPGEALERQAAWLRFPLLLAGIAHLVLTDAERVRRALWPLLPIFAFIAGDLIFQYLSGASVNGTEIQGGRLTSILNRPTSGWFFGKGYFAALCLASAVSLGIKGVVTRQALAFYLLALPILAVVPLTGDRSPILLILTVTALSGLVILASLKRHRVKLLLALAAILLAYGSFLSHQTVVQERSALLAEQIENFWHSHYGQIFKAAWLIFSENWPSGVGVKSFGELCEALKDERIVSLCSTHPHNPYLDWMVVAGLPGRLLWCALAVSLIWPGLRLLRDR
ncbi:O-antigen ligase family protein [Limibacillus halophilus]